MKNRLKYVVLFFAMLFALCVMGGNIAFADDEKDSGASTCSEDEVKKIEEQRNHYAKEGMKESKQKLDAYNAAAENYISACDENLSSDKAVFWSQDAVTEGYVLDGGLAKELFGNQKQYQYTGINWSGLAPSNDNCVKLRDAASVAFDDYRKSRISTTALLLRFSDTKVPRTCICSKNADNQECVAYINTQEDASYSTGKCKMFNEYLAEMGSCPLCVIFEVILNTDSAVAHVGWIKIAKPLRGVVSIFFLVFLALETLKLVGNMAGASTSSYLKSIFGLGLKVAIVLILLQNSSYVYNYFISPVMKGGLEMGQEFLKLGAGGANTAMLYDDSVNLTVSGNELDASLLSSIYSTVHNFNDTALVMPTMGKALMCYGWHNGEILPDLDMWLSGFICYIFGLMIWLAITFYLIDCTVQLGMVCALVPLFIACWPFKMTQRYTTTGVKMILNTFFTFVLLGVVMLVGMEIVSFAVSGGKSGSDMAALISAIDSSNIHRLKALISLDGEKILILIACCIMAMKMIGIADSAASKLSAGAGMKLGAQLGSVANSTAKKVTLGVGAAGLTAGKATVGAAGRWLANNTDAGRAVAKGYKKAKTAVRRFGAGINSTFTESIPAAFGSALGLENFQPTRQRGSGLEDENSIENNNEQNTGGGTERQTQRRNYGDKGDKTQNVGNEMFPPQEHNTGNKRMDDKLKRRDEAIKNGYKTGNKAMDEKLNSKHRQNLQRLEQEGARFGISGKEFDEVQQIQQDWNENEGKDLWQQYDDAVKERKNIEAQGPQYGNDTPSPEMVAARQKEQNILDKIELSRHSYVKQNYNEQTYKNYVKVKAEKIQRAQERLHSETK